MVVGEETSEETNLYCIHLFQYYAQQKSRIVSTHRWDQH